MFKIKTVQENSNLNISVTFFLLLCVGIFFRFFVMTLGYNYDFESYCIVGDISGHFRNVYAETTRYNYGFVFFVIQGVLYRIAEFTQSNILLTYRVLIVSTLTLADIGIALFIVKKYSEKKALVFFLNPISIFITGYHNQFDNIAVFLGLLMSICYNEESEFNKRDISFIALFSIGLITKHILFLLPVFMLLRKSLPLKKKIAYSCIPPFIFLTSFIPFAIGNIAAFNGITFNVFLYRSFNNMPLFTWQFLSVPESLRMPVYILCMILVALITREYEFDRQFLIYLISLVAFSSAIANQYLVIPMVALCVLETKWFKYIYMIFIAVYLLLQYDGLGLLNNINPDVHGLAFGIGNWIVFNGYKVATIMLLFTLIYLLKKDGLLFSVRSGINCHTGFSGFSEFKGLSGFREKFMEKKKIDFKFWLYFFGFLIICFYIYVLFLGSNPDVSIEYQKYFIDEELTHWPGEGGLAIEVGKTNNLFYTDKKKANYFRGLGKGWQSIGEDGTYTKGDESQIIFTSLSEDKDNYKLVIHFDEYNDEQLGVFINQYNITDSLIVSGDECEYTFDSSMLYDYNIVTIIPLVQKKIVSFEIK